MKELLLEGLGWLGYLERPSVLLQVLISLVVLMLCRLARRRHWQGRWPALVIPHLGQLLIGVACLVLAAGGQPFGLAALLGLLWLGWSALVWVRLLLLRWMP